MRRRTGSDARSPRALEEQASSKRAPSIPARIWSGTGLLVVGRVWGSACTLAYLYVLARHLSGDAFGRFTFYLALFMLLDSLADLGTGHVAIQRTASDPSATRAVLKVTRRIRLVAGLAGVLIVGGGAFALGEEGAGWILLATFYPVTHVWELSAITLKNQIAWKRPVSVRAIASTLSLAFVLLLRARDIDQPALYLLGVAAGSTCGNVLLHVVSRRHIAVGPEQELPWKPILKAALPMGIAGLCQQTYFYVDNLFIRALVGSEQLGYYNVAVRFMSYAIMVAVYAPLAALPWLTREHAAGRLAPASARLAQPLFALAGLIAGLMWEWCDELLALFGSEFVAATTSLRYLSLASLTVYAGASLLTSVVAAGRSNAVLWVALTGLAVNLVGNALLVPRLGIEGAALATWATEGSVVLGAAFALARANVALTSAYPWRWLGGPLLFFLGRALGGALSIPAI